MLLHRQTAIGARTRGRVERLRLVERLFDEFGHSFPGIVFELQSASETVNAQAIIRHDGRIVRLYGGLAFHDAADENFLAFVLLHELGHHNAQGGRMGGNGALACECASDHWLRNIALPELNRVIDMDAVVAKIDKFWFCANSTVAGRNCWAANWNRRRKILSGKTLCRSVAACHYA
jgi:hypothetical protein